MQPHELSEKARSLVEQGYLIIENAAHPQTLRRVIDELEPHFDKAPFGAGPFFGQETRRIGGLLARSRASQELVLDETVLGIVNEVLGPYCSNVQLNQTQGIEIHPGAPAQGPHRDGDQWRIPRGTMECQVNVMWALDDFTPRNGATRVWPQSNRIGLEQDLLPEELAIPAVMPQGSACLILGSTMHSGGANLSARPRRGLVAGYCLGWLKPDRKSMADLSARGGPDIRAAACGPCRLPDASPRPWLL
jgi:ectoine hydroxylase-related dioxygenase (phytanoyl-CoA dioxygenase family)